MAGNEPRRDVFPQAMVRFGGYDVSGRGRKMIAVVDVASGYVLTDFGLRDPDAELIEAVDAVVDALAPWRGGLIRDVGEGEEIAIDASGQGPRLLASAVRVVEV